MAPKKRREIEDPNNTWNQQLMAACLEHNVALIEELIEKGADPVHARELTPFTIAETPISPLAALIMQGSSSPNAKASIEALLKHGANVSDLMLLPMGKHLLSPSHSGASDPLASDSGAQFSAPKKISVFDSNDKNKTNSSSIPMEEIQDKGTLLHYLVLSGDHTHLLRALMMIGKPHHELPPALILEELDLEFQLKTQSMIGLGNTDGGNSISPGSSKPTTSKGRNASISGGRLKDANKSAFDPIASDAARRACRSSIEVGLSQIFFLPRLPLPLLPAPLYPPMDAPDFAAALDALHIGLERPLDFECRTSVSGLTAVELALLLGDTLSVRLLMRYGALHDFSTLVNGNQTALARACSQGDILQVETLLDSGADINQLSLDGRYTLIHYAVAQPSMLDFLLRRGLSIDTENFYGESALISLIRFGYGRNSLSSYMPPPAAVTIAPSKEPQSIITQKVAPKPHEIPTCAVGNYILAAPAVLGTANNRNVATSKGQGRSKSQQSISVSPAPQSPNDDAGTVSHYASIDTTSKKKKPPAVSSSTDGNCWWSFAPNTPTMDMIQNLIDRGANSNGAIPDEEAELRWVKFASEATTAVIAALNTPPPVSATNNRAPASRSRLSANQLTSGSRWGANATSVLPPPVRLPTAQDVLEKLEDTRSMVPGRNPLRLTPLMHAIIAYHPSVIRKLVVDCHVDVMRRDSQGACALHYAALSRHKSVMEILLLPTTRTNSTNTPFDLNIMDAAGRTPLHYAAQNGNTEVVELLLTQGTALHAGKPDNKGYTPLHLAVLADQTKVVSLLLRHSDVVMEVTSSTASLTTAAHRKAGGRGPRSGGGSGRYQRHNNSISSGAANGNGYTMVDVEAEDYENGYTPLEMAIVACNPVSSAMVRMLLQEGHAISHRPSGLPSGGTLSHRAAFDGNMEVVEILMEHYSDPNETDANDHTPLHIALQQLIRLRKPYLESGSLEDDLQYDKAKEPYIRIVHILLLYGANPHAQGGDTLDTPIHLASRLGDKQVLQFVLHQAPDHLDYEFNAIQTIPTRHPSDSYPSDGFISGRARNRSNSFSSKKGNDKRGKQKWLDFDDDLEYHSRARGSGTDDMDSSNVDELPPPPSLHSRPSIHEMPLPAENIQPLLQESYFLLTDAQARTPLHILCSHFHPKTQTDVLPSIQELLNCSIGRELCEMVDQKGRRVLHEACLSSYLEAVQLILRIDSECPFAMDANGKTPLHDCVTSVPAEIRVSRDYATLSSLSRHITGARHILPRRDLAAQTENQFLKRSMECVKEILRSVGMILPHAIYGFSSLPVVSHECFCATAVNSAIDMQPYPLSSSITESIRKRKCGVGDPMTRQGPFPVVSTIKEYLNLPDGEGRTALLLAAEVGDPSIGIQLLRYCRDM